MPKYLAGTWKGIAVGLALSLGFAGAARVAMARNGDSPTSGGDAASSPPRTDAAKGNAAADPNSPVVLELKELEQTVAAQTKQFDEHSKELDGERAALHDELARIANLEAALGMAPEASPSPNPPDAATVAALVSGPPPATDQNSQVQTPQDLSDRIGNLEDRLKNFGPFSFSGDIRLRDEPTFGGPSNGSLDQNRERFRLRFNVDAKLNDDFTGGFSLASGDINNPISDNQTVGDFYARKSIAIDKAFVQYSPHEFHALTLVGGKFGYPWYNTELVWDKDLNPEGAAETLAFDLKSAPVLKRVALVGFELPFTQVAGVSLNNKSLVTSAVYGGQLQTTWQLTSWLKFGAFTGFYNYHNADPIALALARASADVIPRRRSPVCFPWWATQSQNSILTTTATNDRHRRRHGLPDRSHERLRTRSLHRNSGCLIRWRASISSRRRTSGRSRSLATTCKTRRRARNVRTSFARASRIRARFNTRNQPISPAIRASAARIGEKCRWAVGKNAAIGSLITPACSSNARRCSQTLTTAKSSRAAT